MSFPVHNVSSEPLCLGLTSHEGAEIPLCIILLDENTGNCPLGKHYLICSLAIIMWTLIVGTSQLDPLTLDQPKDVSKEAQSTNGNYTNRMWKYIFLITMSHQIQSMVRNIIVYFNNKYKLYHN